MKYVLRAYLSFVLIFIFACEPQTQEQKKLNSTTTKEVKDSSNVDIENTEEEKAKEVYKLSSGILLCDGMIMQMFGGPARLSKKIAKVINLYQEKLNKDTQNVQVYSVVAPTHAAIYLPKSYTAFRCTEIANIDSLNTYLNPKVIAVNPSHKLKKYKKEYLYFNSDHHWTGRGAYYAYQAFCEKAGFEAIPLQDMERKVIPNFQGTLYSNIPNALARAKKDSVEYFKPAIQYKTYALSGANYQVEKETRLFIEMAKGKAAYGVFIGADYLALKIKTEKKNNRRVLIIKNSYGNAFAPLLISHFEEVFITDYRFFKGTVQNFVKYHNITDVILMNNTFSANTPSTIQKFKTILGY